MRAKDWLVALLTVACCHFFSSTAKAQYCNNRVFYASSPTYYYSTPSYGHTATKSVTHYPGWTYNHQDGYYYKDKEYHYPVQKVVAQEVQLAPLIVTVPVASVGVPVEAYGQKHYYTVTEAYQQKAQIRDIIREELRSALVGGGTAPATTATPAPPVTNSANPATGSVPSGRGAGTPAAGQRWEADTSVPEAIQAPVLATFTSHCGTCHSSGTAGGIKLMVDGPGGKVFLPKLSREQKWAVYGALSTGVMPPEAAKDANKAVPNEKLPAILRWVLQK